MSFTKEQRVINSMLNSTSKERSQPVVNKDTEGFVIPNYSGDHKGGTKRDDPVNDLDLVNKKYVDDQITNINDTASRVKVVKGDSQTLSDATITVLEYNTESFDNLGEYDNATNYRFTATQAGYYEIKASILTGQVVWTSGDSGFLRIYKNGSADSTLDRKAIYASVTDFMHLHGSTIVYLEANDYIDIRIYIDRGGNTATYDGGGDTLYNWFTVHRLS